VSKLAVAATLVAKIETPDGVHRDGNAYMGAGRIDKRQGFPTARRRSYSRSLHRSKLIY
jgi:hypothetical protein